MLPNTAMFEAHAGLQSHHLKSNKVPECNSITINILLIFKFLNMHVWFVFPGFRVFSELVCGFEWRRVTAVHPPTHHTRKPQGSAVLSRERERKHPLPAALPGSAQIAARLESSAHMNVWLRSRIITVRRSGRSSISEQCSNRRWSREHYSTAWLQSRVQTAAALSSWWAAFQQQRLWRMRLHWMLR